MDQNCKKLIPTQASLTFSDLSKNIIKEIIFCMVDSKNPALKKTLTDAFSFAQVDKNNLQIWNNQSFQDRIFSKLQKRCATYLSENRKLNRVMPIILPLSNSPEYENVIKSIENSKKEKLKLNNNNVANQEEIPLNTLNQLQLTPLKSKLNFLYQKHTHTT